MSSGCERACSDCFKPAVINKLAQTIAERADTISAAIGVQIDLAATIAQKTDQAVAEGLPAETIGYLQRWNIILTDRVMAASANQGSIVEVCKVALSEAQAIQCVDTTEYFEDICPRRQRLQKLQATIAEAILHPYN